MTSEIAPAALRLILTQPLGESTRGNSPSLLSPKNSFSNVAAQSATADEVAK